VAIREVNSQQRHKYKQIKEAQIKTDILREEALTPFDYSQILKWPQVHRQ